MFSGHVLPMRYNSGRLEINVVISTNVLLFKDIKISLGHLITTRKMHALISCIIFNQSLTIFRHAHTQ